MSKYDPLWKWVRENCEDSVSLRFSEIEKILAFPLDHSFLACKKELAGFSVKVSMKNGTVSFEADASMSAPFDFKRECGEYRLPKGRPEILTVPRASFVAVRGRGNPNEEGGAYQRAVNVLYAVAYTLKMSRRADHTIEGFYDYVVPPLEGFWWQEGIDGVDFSDKSAFCWISAIRLPDFVAKKDFDWAVEMAAKKKKLDCAKAEFLSLDEGLCVQMTHVGPFDDEPATVEKMDAYISENGYENDFSDARLHHEIYFSDPRKTAPEKRRTVIRHPIRKREGNEGQ